MFEQGQGVPDWWLRRFVPDNIKKQPASTSQTRVIATSLSLDRGREPKPKDTFSECRNCPEAPGETPRLYARECDGHGAPRLPQIAPADPNILRAEPRTTSVRSL